MIFNFVLEHYDVIERNDYKEYTTQIRDTIKLGTEKSSQSVEFWFRILFSHNRALNLPAARKRWDTKRVIVLVHSRPPTSASTPVCMLERRKKTCCLGCQLLSEFHELVCVFTAVTRLDLLSFAVGVIFPTVTAIHVAWCLLGLARFIAHKLYFWFDLFPNPCPKFFACVRDVCIHHNSLESNYSTITRN